MNIVNLVSYHCEGAQSFCKLEQLIYRAGFQGMLPQTLEGVNEKAQDEKCSSAEQTLDMLSVTNSAYNCSTW